MAACPACNRFRLAHSRVWRDEGPGQDAGAKCSSATVEDAARSGEVVVIALPWPVTKQVLPTLAGVLDEKIVIDATNPVAQWPAMDHAAGSGGEEVAAMVPSARVIKTFNSTGFDNIREPQYPDGPTTMFYGGDDPTAKGVVGKLIGDLGFDPVDCGPLSISMQLESLASLWGQLAMGRKMGRNIAFRLMRR